VIFDKKVAMTYYSLMTEVIDVEINTSKSVIGKLGKSQIEFTKRFALNGEEMSSIKRNILTKSSIVNILDLADMLISRDFISPSEFHYCDSPEGRHSFEEILNFML
jgi:hypothetical protein